MPSKLSIIELDLQAKYLNITLSREALSIDKQYDSEPSQFLLEQAFKSSNNGRN